MAPPSQSSRAARGARIFARQSETGPGWRLIAAGAGFPLSAAKTALSASSTSRLAFTDELLWSQAPARQWPARRAGAGPGPPASLLHHRPYHLSIPNTPDAAQPGTASNCGRARAYTRRRGHDNDTRPQG